MQREDGRRVWVGRDCLGGGACKAWASCLPVAVPSQAGSDGVRVPFQGRTGSGDAGAVGGSPRGGTRNPRATPRVKCTMACPMNRDTPPSAKTVCTWVGAQGGICRAGGQRPMQRGMGAARRAAARLGGAPRRADGSDREFPTRPHATVCHRALPSGCWPRGIIHAPRSRMTRDGGTCLGGRSGRGPGHDDASGTGGRRGRLGSGNPDRTPCNSLPTVSCRQAAGPQDYRRAEVEDGSRWRHLLGRTAGSRPGHDGESGTGGGGGRLGSGNPDRTPRNSLALIPGGVRIDRSRHGRRRPAIHDSYEVSPVKWKFAHLATFPSVFSCCD